MSFGLWGIVVTCLLASSIEPILVKIGFLGGVSPFLLVALRFIFAGIAVAIVGQKSFIHNFEYKTYLKVLPLAILLLLTNSFTIIALLFSNPSLVITIITLTPAFVGICSYVFGYEDLGFSFWLGVLFAFIGVFVTINSQVSLAEITNAKGVVFSFFAVITSTTYRIFLGRKTKELQSKVISSYIFINNGLVGLACLPFLYQQVTWKVGVISFWTGIAAVCANLAFVYAVKNVGVARMSVIDLLQRPLVIVLSIMILGESVSLSQVLGVILVSLGVYFAIIK
jgi:drug/metabolite transporter (DMT)-like permease